MKYAVIRVHRDEFSVRAMCRVPRVHFSGFYAWLKEPLSQRAAIARAVVSNPEVIFADEPTAALDRETAQPTIRMLKTL